MTVCVWEGIKPHWPAASHTSAVKWELEVGAIPSRVYRTYPFRFSVSPSPSSAEGSPVLKMRKPARERPLWKGAPCQLAMQEKEISFRVATVGGALCCGDTTVVKATLNVNVNLHPSIKENVFLNSRLRAYLYSCFDLSASSLL